MKKLLLSTLFAIAALSCNAQSEKYPYYCMINGFRNLAGQVRIEVEWGEKPDLVYLRDERGKKIEFNNLTDILNYMSKRGWEFMSTAYYDDRVHYLLKKNVSSPEEAKEGLRFDTDKKIAK